MAEGLLTGTLGDQGSRPVVETPAGLAGPGQFESRELRCTGHTRWIRIDLPVPHGAPVRVRVETQMGYKSLKYLQRIVVADEFDDLGKFGNLQNGWSWYAGI